MQDVPTTAQDRYMAESQADGMFTTNTWMEGSQEEKDEYVQDVPTTDQDSYVAESQTDGINTTNHWVNESIEEKYEYVPDDENMETQLGGFNVHTMWPEYMPKMVRAECDEMDRLDDILEIVNIAEEQQL